MTTTSATNSSGDGEFAAAHIESYLSERFGDKLVFRDAKGAPGGGLPRTPAPRGVHHLRPARPDGSQLVESP